MTSGVEVFNNEKTLQITNKYLPMCLRKSGEITSKTRWGYGVQPGFGGARVVAGSVCWSEPIDLSDYNCAVVYFKADAPESRVSIMISPDQKLYFLKWWNFNIINPIKYYIFDQWIPPERSKSGLQLFNRESEGVMFDSSWYLMSIIQVHTIPVNTPALNWGSDYAYEVETGLDPKNIAVGLSTYREIWVDYWGSGGSGGVNGTVGWVLKDCVWNEGSKVKVSYVNSWLDNTSYGSYPTDWFFTKETYLYVIDTSRLPNPYG